MIELVEQVLAGVTPNPHATKGRGSHEGLLSRPANAHDPSAPQ